MIYSHSFCNRGGVMEKISIIVPCYNEENCIKIFYKELIKYLSKINLEYEIIFVDDGSKDETLNIIKKIKDVNVKYISFSRNFGKEAAMYAGLKKSKGNYVVIMDADLQDPPRLLPKMIKEIQKSDYDSIATRRTDRKKEPRIRSFLANLFYKIFNKMTGFNIVSGARDYRLMKRNMVNAILEIAEKERFTKGIFAWIGFKTKWISFSNVNRSFGTTKWSFWELFKYSVSGLTSYSDFPLFISYIFSGVFFIISIILLFLFLFNIWLNELCLIILVITSISSVNFFTIGIMSLYLSKNYKETRNRPLYIIKEIKE